MYCDSSRNMGAGMGTVAGSGTNQSGTILVLESLVRRGLVVKTREQIAWGQTYVDRDVYRVKVLAP
jgi:hypothetical protein